MVKLRVQITKGDEVRYISHLDYAGAIERAIRRAKLPASYSEGFNPHMKLAFASALGLGVTSESEYMDVELTSPIDPAAVQDKLNASLPLGITVRQAGYMDEHSPALMAVVNLAEYCITVPLLNEAGNFAVQESIRRFNTADEVPFIRESPKRKREIELKSFLANGINAVVDGNHVRLFMQIKITPAGSVKAGEILTALVEGFALPVVEKSALIHRVGLYIQKDNIRHTPLP